MDSKTDRIRELNDSLRVHNRGGRLMTTRSFAALPVSVQVSAVQAMRGFQDFNGSNDPYGEHDAAIFECGGETFFFKVDYYNSDLSAGSEDPSDPAVTQRVLTLMLASDM